MKNIVVTLALLFLLGGYASAQKMSSPQKTITADLFLDSAGALSYRAHRGDVTICDSSALGLTVDGVDLYRNVEIECVGSRRIRQTYPVVGSHSVANNSCVQYDWQIVHKPTGYKYTIQAKLFDDGFAYRTIMPGRGVRRVNREAAQWRLPQSSKVWFAERNSAWKLLTYAGEWISTRADNLHSASSQGAIQLMPLVYDMDDSDLYLAVSEAALYDYSGIRLVADSLGRLNANFTEADGFDVEGDITTPWRVLIAVDGLNALVNTDIVTNLAPAADPKLFKDKSWIKPGRSLWSWWSGIDGEFMTISGEKKVIDIASDLGYEYSTLDEGWENFDDKWTTIKSLAKYADRKNVGLFVWRHWNMLNDETDDYAQMRYFMDSVSRCGVKGLKIDFMNGEGKRQTDFTTAVLKNAAKSKLLINFHGCQKPSGESVTYPNELTREGVRGIELNRITAHYLQKNSGVKQKYVPGNENQNIPASHNAALPLTRCILGAADYTPIAFSMSGNTSVAHQLATAYLINSPLQTIAENPFYLMREPRLKPCLEFIRDLPTVWDQTIVLDQSAIGEQVVFARRKGDVWYLAAINTEAVSWEFKLDFLANGSYGMTLITDKNSSEFAVSTKTVKSDQSVTISLNANSGFVAKFVKSK